MYHSTAKTVHEYVISQNMLADFFSVAQPDCWMGKLMAAPLWEKEYGITTVEQLVTYLDECSEKNAADAFYYAYEEHIRDMEKREADNLKTNKEKYCKNEDFTYNPFKNLDIMVTKTQ